MEITALHNQSFLDISIQHTGSVFNAFAIAVANGCAVSDSPVVGQKYTIPENVENDNDVLNYYKAKSIQPATAISDVTIIPAGRGIGWMRIGGDFKVS